MSNYISLDITLCFADCYKRDIDNYLKIIFDSLKNTVIHDDTQIMELTLRKAITDSPCILIEITELPMSYTHDKPITSLLTTIF